jgi:transposase
MKKRKSTWLKKRAISRKLGYRPTAAVVLMQDETILRLFPVLRRAWSRQGRQAQVKISGRNAQQVLSCALNIRTGRRLLVTHQGMTAAGFGTMLQCIHRAYKSRPVYLLLDNGGLHRAKANQKLAGALNIILLWLPKQASELNAVDQLWRHVKAQISANRQYKSIQEHGAAAEVYLKGLSPKQTLRLAGVLSENFWLKNKVETNFCRLT